MVSKNPKIPQKFTKNPHNHLKIEFSISLHVSRRSIWSEPCYFKVLCTRDTQMSSFRWQVRQSEVNMVLIEQYVH